MKRLVVLTGAGMSAESGLSTFRDSGGLWEGYDVMEVASIEGWNNNQSLVLDFYNERRQNAQNSSPNEGHVNLAKLEQYFETHIITQNVDDLHERAGSRSVLHLHGSLFESKSSGNNQLVYPTRGRINLGDTCEEGFQLRPNIVWFGEPVPMIEEAAKIVSTADVFVVIGTSLVVYPAAGLANFAPTQIPKYIIDPIIPDTGNLAFVYPIKAPATEGTRELLSILLNSGN